MRSGVLDGSAPRPPWAVEALGRPWGERPSIYAHVRRHLPPEGPGLLPGGHLLPDDERARFHPEIRFAPGALDGAFGPRAGAEEAERTASALAGELVQLSRAAEPARFARLYETASAQQALSYLDALLIALQGRRDLHRARLAELARWMAREAPDREAVKLALGLIGLAGRADDLDLLLTLGRHDELTSFAAVAIWNTRPRPERALWRLGRSVEGWGRIHVVGHLTSARDPEIRRWLLLEGYENSVLSEYSALICATTGDLVGALRETEPGAAVLDAAADLLAALVSEHRPAAGIEEYADGLEAVERFLDHVAACEPSLRQLAGAAAIERFVHDDRQTDRSHPGLEAWTAERRAEIAAAAAGVLSGAGARRAVDEGLASADRMSFHLAVAVGPRVGVDPWDAVFARLEGGEDRWYEAMQTDRSDRVDQVVALAERLLPLDEIATGPARKIGLGPAYRNHYSLDFLLQGLVDFPGHGWGLIRTGLRSPVEGNRWRAIKALAAWDRSGWPPEAEHAIRRAIREEPDVETKEALLGLLAGSPPVR